MEALKSTSHAGGRRGEREVNDGCAFRGVKDILFFLKDKKARKMY